MNRSPRTTIALVGAIALTIGVAGPASAAATPAPTHDEQITFQEWSSYGDWRAGTHDGTVALPVAGLTMLRPAGTTDYADPHTGQTRTWNYATWTSPVTPGRLRRERARRVVERADTPAGTWIQVELQGTYNTGDQTPWYVMGRWASGDERHPAHERQPPGRPVVHDLHRHVLDRRRGQRRHAARATSCA